MSKRTDKIAAKAKLAAENAAKEAKGLEDKLAIAEAADREDARSSPADKAMERAFARGELPVSDRRALGFDATTENPLKAILDALANVGTAEAPANVSSVAPDVPAVDPAAFIDAITAPTAPLDAPREPAQPFPEPSGLPKPGHRVTTAEARADREARER